MRSRLAGVAVLAGCSFGAPVGGNSPGDGGEDPPGDACVTFSAQTDTCLLQPGGPLELSGNLELSTLTGMLVDLDTGASIEVTRKTLATLGVPVEAILATSITLAPGTRLRAVGPKGFGLVAIDSITLGDGAVIDVADGGAGSQATCVDGPTVGEGAGGGGAGGGGGGFGGEGGPGGRGNSDNIIDGTTDGGKSGDLLAVAPSGPRGGCPGAAGGDGDDPGGSGGNGGGAAWLAAGRRITLAATAGINAGGGGGRGGGQGGNRDGDAGGGGGGSGGVIWLEAPQVRSTGTLAANGGGGGEGSGGRQAGTAGQTGGLVLDRAAGGAGGSDSGSAGGGGGHVVEGAGQVGALPEPGGGGGGGGGVGFIRVVSADRVLGAMSPAAP